MKKYKIFLLLAIFSLVLPIINAEESPFDIAIELSQTTVKQGDSLNAFIFITSSLVTADIIPFLQDTGVLTSTLFELFIEVADVDGNIVHTEKREVDISEAWASLSFDYNTKGISKGEYTIRVYSPLQNIDKSKAHLLPEEYADFADIEVLEDSETFSILSSGVSIDEKESYIMDPEIKGLARIFSVKRGGEVESLIAIKNEDAVEHSVKLVMSICPIDDFLCNHLINSEEYDLFLVKGDKKNINTKIKAPDREGPYTFKTKLLDEKGNPYSAITTKMMVIEPSLRIKKLRFKDKDGILLPEERGIVLVEVGSSTSASLSGFIENVNLNIVVNDLSASTVIFQGSKVVFQASKTIPRVDLDPLKSVNETFDFSYDKPLKNYEICSVLTKENIQYDKSCLSADNSALLSNANYDLDIDFKCLVPCIDCKPCELYSAEVKIAPKETEDSLIDSMVVLNTRTNDLIKVETASNFISFNIEAEEKDIMLIISDENNQLKLPIQTPQESFIAEAIEEGTTSIDAGNTVRVNSTNVGMVVREPEVRDIYQNIIMPPGEFYLPLSTRITISKEGKIEFYDRDGTVKEPIKIESQKCYTKLSFEGKTIITLFPENIILTQFREGSKSITIQGETKTVLNDHFDGSNYIFNLLDGEQVFVASSCQINFVEKQEIQEPEVKETNYRFILFIIFDIILVIVFILLIIHHQKIARRKRPEEKEKPQVPARELSPKEREEKSFIEKERAKIDKKIWEEEKGTK